WTDRRDPPGGVLFRLIRFAEPRYFVNSMCNQDGIPSTTTGERAVRLHADVEVEGETGTVSLVMQYETEIIPRVCDLALSNSAWRIGDCLLQGQTELTEDAIDIRVALYGYHAVP